MARPKKQQPDFEIPIHDSEEEAIKAFEEKSLEPVKPSKVLCKAFHMVIGVDLIGSKTSLSTSKNMELEVTPLGIKAYSKSSKRLVLIPWTNIKGAELFT